MIDRLRRPVQRERCFGAFVLDPDAREVEAGRWTRGAPERGARAGSR